MPDWAEHATTIVFLLGGLAVVLVKGLWNTWVKREAIKEGIVATALSRIGDEVSGLRTELKDMAREVFDRLSAHESALAEVKARCETLHSRWEGIERRQPTPQEFGFGSLLGGTEKR